MLGTSPEGAAGYDKISRKSSRCKALPLLGFQKGRYARNGPFPLKNGLFLVYSTIAEIRCKFYHIGPSSANFTISGSPKGGWAQKRPISIEKPFRARQRADGAIEKPPRLGPPDVWSPDVWGDPGTSGGPRTSGGGARN